MPRNKKIISSLLATILILACVPTLSIPSTPISTFDPNSILTAIVETANAAATQTQKFAPPTLTPTVTDTRTPLPTETITPTFIFLLPTATIPPTQIPVGSSGLELECQIISQDPPNGSLLQKSVDFVVRWTIANVGTHTWPSDNTDYRYISGDKLHIQSIYDLEKNVIAGDTIELFVNMQTPANVGTYSTSWRIVIGKEQFCPLNLNIIVG